MAMVISWVARVNPSHPYLENDPAPSFAPTICAFHLGFSLVLTDGQTWQIYDLGKRGKFQNKLIEQVCIGEETATSIAKVLNQTLRKNLNWSKS